MAKKEIIASVAEELGFTQKDVRAAVELFIDKFIGNIKSLDVNDKISIPGLGAFFMKERAAHMSRNPKTGASVSVPTKRKVSFKPSKDLKDSLNS